MMSHKKWIPILFLSSVVITIFQNCAPNMFLAARGDGMTNNLSIDHPDISGPNLAKTAAGHILVGDREYLESVFLDVFSSPQASPDEQNYINAVIYQEFAPEQQMLGRSCDPLQDGTLNRCNYSLTNVDTAMLANSSAIREAAQVQVCRRLLANDGVLAVVLGKIRGSQSAPTDQSIAGMIELFFPVQDGAQDAKSALLELDRAMAQKPESLTDRWRLLLLTVCESPSWQVL